MTDDHRDHGFRKVRHIGHKAIHSLYDHASVMLGVTFKDAQNRLHETNATPLTEEEGDHHFGNSSGSRRR